VSLDAELKSLKIDRNQTKKGGNWAKRWIIGGVLLFALAGAANFGYRMLNAPVVSTALAPPPLGAGAQASGKSKPKPPSSWSA